MNKKELKSFHYNNQNEIQFEYGGQTHHYSMECLKDIICNYFNNLKEIDRLNNIRVKALEFTYKELIPENVRWDYDDCIFSDLPVERIKPLVDILELKEDNK